MGQFDHVKDDGVREALQAFYTAVRGSGRPRTHARPPQPLWRRCGDCGGNTQWERGKWLCPPCETKG